MGLTALALAGVAGCDRWTQEPEQPSSPVPRVVVRSFTDGASVLELAAAPPHVFAATDVGVDRWDLEAGERQPLELPGELGAGEARALAVDPSGSSLWLAGSETVGRYDVEAGTWHELPRVPEEALGAEPVELAADGDDAAWLGGEFGLAYAGQGGAWSITDVGSPVTALHMGEGGALWVGTERGLLAMTPEGEAASVGSDASCPVGSVRILASSLGGGVLAVGDTRDGQRIAVVEDGACRMFRASPDVRWMDVASTGAALAVLTERRLYATGRGSGGARQLDRDGMRLLALSGEARALAGDYRLRPLDVRVPSGARALGMAGDEILVGTEELGTARVSLASRERMRWLRRGSVADGASGLTVECAAADDCFIATGERKLWHFDGERVRAEPAFERAILAVVASSSGALHAIRRGEREGTIELARREGEEWVLLEDLVIEVPGWEPELSFARLSPTGILWLGLRYRDDTDAVRPYGVALVDLSLGVVAYHRATMVEEELAQGVLPIPINAIDVSFVGPETWLATSEGAAAVRDDGTVELFTEAEGLRSEILRGVAVNPGGTVFVATRAGVGMFDGTSWQFPRSLRYSVRALDFAEDGRLWMATDRGLAAFDGHRVRRLDARRGLLEDELRDLAIDGHGRVWVRGNEGLTVVTP